MLNRKHDILIVGQGLAGTVLSGLMLKAGIAHRVVDNHHHAAATKAAAGLINPVTGRSYVKSWMIEELLPSARALYRFFEELLHIELVTEMPVLRTLPTPAHINKWHSSVSRPGYDAFIEDKLDSYQYDDILIERKKYGVIKNSCQVDISGLIEKYQGYLVDRGILEFDKFDFSQLRSSSTSVTYKSREYEAVVFCEGYQAIYNPFFKNLPFQPAKGEAFEIEIEGFNSNQILRDEIFIVPLPNKLFWSGGSYIWNFEDHHPTEKWRWNWTAKLDELIDRNYIIHSHKAGIRPSVKGRRPLAGRHHSNSNIYIFNGLGTKGTSLAPYWAEQFIESYFIKNEEIDDAVNINRFEY